MSRFTLSVTYTLFNNKLPRYVHPILPTLVYRNVYLNVSKYIPPPVRLPLDFIQRSRSILSRTTRPFARSHRAPFLLSPYCLHLVPVSITLAPVRLTGRDDAAASALSRVALLSVACAELLRRAKHLGRRHGHRRIRRASLGRSLRSSRREKRSIRDRFTEIRAPDWKRRFRSVHSRDRSIPRSTSPTFPPLNVHTGFETIRDVSPFLFAIVS